MKRAGRFSLLILLAWGCFSSAVRADLASEIQRVLQDKLLDKASVGIEIVHLGPPSAGSPAQATILYQHDPEKPLMPASNMKLLTTSAALDRLGPDFKFRTMLVQRGRDLVLVGDGDPSFGDNELLKKHGWTVTTVFQHWAQELRKVGLTSFDNVLVDDSIFEMVMFHPNWPARQEQARYMAQIAGMSLNVNCIDLAVRSAGSGAPAKYALTPDTRYVSVQNGCISGGQNAVWLSRVPRTNTLSLRGTVPLNGEVLVSVTVHDPALYAATVFSEQLAAEGIQISGKVARDRTVRAAMLAAARSSDGGAKSGLRLLAVHETPIAQILSRANKDSVNLYAESLCKRLGYELARVSKTPAERNTVVSGSWSNGPAAVGEFLKKVGVSEGQFHLDDGCGLSRENGISAGSLSRVLQYNFAGKNRDFFLSTLAVGGEDGTLDNRFERMLKGRVFAKTGYINNVSALSGYLHGRDGQWYVFSILMNELPAYSNTRAKELQERIVRAIDQESRLVTGAQGGQPAAGG